MSLDAISHRPMCTGRSCRVGSGLAGFAQTFYFIVESRHTAILLIVLVGGPWEVLNSPALAASLVICSVEALLWRRARTKWGLWYSSCTSDERRALYKSLYSTMIKCFVEQLVCSQGDLRTCRGIVFERNCVASNHYRLWYKLIRLIRCWQYPVELEAIYGGVSSSAYVGSC